MIAQVLFVRSYLQIYLMSAEVLVQSGKKMRVVRPDPLPSMELINTLIDAK